MLDLLKKTMMTGIGLALRSKDEAEEFIKEFIFNASTIDFYWDASCANPEATRTGSCYECFIAIFVF